MQNLNKNKSSNYNAIAKNMTKLEQTESKSTNKKNKQKYSDKYKQLCTENIRAQPPNYIVNNYIQQRDKSLQIDLSLIQIDDLHFVYQLFKLPIIKVTILYQQSRTKNQEKQNTQLIKQFHQTHKFTQFLRQSLAVISSISQTGQSTQVSPLKSLMIKNIPLTNKHMKILSNFICKTATIRQLSIINCEITDALLEELKVSLCKNQSLAILNLSDNKLGHHSGAMIGKVLSEHSGRRDQIVWMASLRSEQIDASEQPSMKGLCQINIQNNQLDDYAINQMIKYLKNDQWTRCINLKNNKIQKQGIKLFAMLMKKNLTIISLDLRLNPGFNKQYSKYIIGKLKQNISRYKQYKMQSQNDTSNNNKNNSKKPSKLKPSKNKQDKHKSMQQSRRKSMQQNSNFHNNLQFSIANNTLQAEPMTKKIGQNNSMAQQSYQSCARCKQKTMQMLKLEKKSLDLQMELKRLRKVLLRNNIDTNISAIQPQHHLQPQHSIAFESFHKITGTHPESDSQLIMKVEQIMMELTKIMENIDAQQNSQINMSNNFSNAHSLSNTIPLYPKPDQLEEAFGINYNLNQQMLSPNRVLSSPNHHNSHDETS